MYTTVRERERLKERIKQQSKDRTSIDKRYVLLSMDTTEKLRNDLQVLVDNDVIVKATFKDAQYLYRCMLEWKIEVDGCWEYGVTEHSEGRMMDETGISKKTLNRCIEVLLKLGYIEIFEADRPKTPHVYVANLLPPNNETQLANMIKSTGEKQAPERKKQSVEALEEAVNMLTPKEETTQSEPIVEENSFENDLEMTQEEWDNWFSDYGKDVVPF